MSFKKKKKEILQKKKKIIFLEKHLQVFLKKRGLQDQGFLLAVSGGFDSMLMMEVFYRIQKVFPLMRLYVAYVHHGEDRTAQGKYRNKAFQWVCKTALSKGLPFFSNLKPSNLKGVFPFEWDQIKDESRVDLKGLDQIKNKGLKKDSARAYILNGIENDFLNFRKKSQKKSQKEKHSIQKEFQGEAFYRNLRYFILRRIKEKVKADAIVLAHFKNDLLETRLIRLIRGTGLLGLKAMSEFDGELMRPFLFFKKEDFFKDAVKEGLQYVEDPSNEDLSFLRNWVRNHFLRSLEKVRPGSFESLFRSLENISKEQTQWNPLDFIQKRKILYPLFLELDLERKISVLSCYMREMGLKNYTLNHIYEILKRIKSPREKIHFKLLKVSWELNADYIQIKEVDHFKKVDR